MSKNITQPWCMSKMPSTIAKVIRIFMTILLQLMFQNIILFIMLFFLFIIIIASLLHESIPEGNV